MQSGSKPLPDDAIVPKSIDADSKDNSKIEKKDASDEPVTKKPKLTEKPAAPDSSSESESEGAGDIDSRISERKPWLLLSWTVTVICS